MTVERRSDMVRLVLKWLPCLGKTKGNAYVGCAWNGRPELETSSSNPRAHPSLNPGRSSVEWSDSEDILQIQLLLFGALWIVSEQGLYHCFWTEQVGVKCWHWNGKDFGKNMEKVSKSDLSVWSKLVCLEITKWGVEQGRMEICIKIQRSRRTQLEITSR